MIAYSIEYKIGNQHFDTSIDAKNLESARNKIARKHGVDKSKVTIIRHFYIGFF